MQKKSNYAIILLRFAVFNLNKINTAFFVVGGSMFKEQFEIIENDSNHIQYKHININSKDFNRYIVKSIFEDNELYKYVTNDIEKDEEEFGNIYPIKQLIHLVKNLKKEYISEYLPIDLKKKLCKELKAKYNGKVIDVKKQDWQEKFQVYLDENMTGYDVVAEIIMSKIIEDKFNANVFVTKLAQVTNNNMKVFGIDTVHYNENTNTMFFGESKLTNNVDLGINQHKAELILMDYKMNEECKLFALRKNDIRCKDKIVHDIVRFGKKLTSEENLSILRIKKEDSTFDIAIVYFIAHGDKYDYDYVTSRINNFRKKIKFKDISVFCVTLPIKDKNDFIKQVQEVISEYEK